MTAVDTHLLLRALVDELARSGVGTAVTSPGSRNTPLIEAFVAEPRLASFSHLDERSGGFFAVGAARASGLPVAVTVTSGTAVANLLPAVIEASEGGLPLIVLSADRPAELRQIGAGQTIDQLKIFGDSVRFFAELDLSEATPERMRWVRSVACRACLTALGSNPGPVHLNIPLREPLVLDVPLPDDPAGGEGRPQGRPWVRGFTPPVDAGADTERPGAEAETPQSAVRPQSAVIVAGQVAIGPEVSRRGAELAAFAAAHGIPLLADPLSGARRGSAAIAHYDLILRDPGLAQALAPELVIRVGELPTSKPLRAWLAGLDGVNQLVFHPLPVWPDPDSSMSQISRFAGPEALPHPAQPAGWLERWRAGDTIAGTTIATVLEREAGLTEPGVAVLLGDQLPPEATLFVAASMPIRDVEEFLAVRDDPPRVLANRGANGIDGTVSAAFGTAAVSSGPVVLVIGDVALAHDLGGLLAARRTGARLTIVLINNDGGGIFNFLAIAGHAPAFDQHVATPHGLEFAHAAALYGFDHVTATDVGGFKAALNRALAGSASTIIEVRTDRVANRLLHAEIARAAGAAFSPIAPVTAPGA
jgi:2-succinyl-5-enolpyruvyl-6-hydroxy-3-cyclohexene-1-carboxylate synthase